MPGGETAVLAAAEALPFGVAITDLRGLITWANAAYAQLAGSTPDDLPGQSVGEFAWDSLAHAAPSPEPWRGRTVCSRKTGESYSAEFSITALRTSAGEVTGFWVTKRDTAGLKRHAGVPYEANLSALIESSDDLIWSVDLNFALVTFNTALRDDFERNFGVRAEVGMRPEDLLPPERAALWPAMYRRALTEGPFRAEYSLLDGRTLELAFNPILHDGKATGISVFGKDITQRKKAEKALRDAETEYRGLFENALEGIYRTSTGGTSLTANPALARMLGYQSPAEVMSMVTDLARQVWLDPAERASFLQLIDRQGIVRGYECQFKRKDGTALWVAITGRKVCGADGQTLYLEGYVEDITERKRAEAEMEPLRSVFQSMGQGAAFCKMLIAGNRAQDIVYIAVNPAFEKLTGLANVQGKRVSEAIPGLRQSNPELFDTFARVVLTGNPEHFEILLKPLGIWLSFSVYRPRPEHFLAVFDNITERKRAEEALRQANEAIAQGEANLSALIESTGDIIWSVDLNYRLLTFNRALYEAFDRSFGVQAAVGMGPEDLLLPERAALWPPLYRRALSEGPFRAEYTLLDGRNLELAFNPILQDGRTTGFSVFGKDITERKAAEKTLRNAEDKYRNIFEGALEGIFRTTRKRFLDANPALAQMLGYDSAQDFIATVADMPQQVWMNPDERSIYLQLLEKQGVVRGYECRFKRKDGAAIWVSLSARKVCGQDESAAYYEGFLEDITERKRMEESLRKSEEQFAKVFLSSPAIVTLCDLTDDGRLVEVNEAFELTNGYRREEAVGRTALELGLWADPAEYEESARQFRAAGRLRNFEHRFRTKQGAIGTGLTSVEVVEIGGKPFAISATIDITEKKEADARLKAQSKRFQGIIENTDAGYFRIGADGCYQDVNPAWLRMYGFTRKEDAIGLHFSTVQNPEDLGSAQEMVQSLMRGEPVKSGEFSRLRRDGTIGYHSFSANPVFDGDRVAGIEGFLVDISDRKKAEQERLDTEQRYRSLFISMQEGVAVHKLVFSDGIAQNYVLLDVNRRYEEIVGVRREDVVNKLATDAYGTPDAPYLKEYASVVQSGSPYQFETYFPPMDKHFVISVAHMGDDCFATIFFDISEQKRTQQAIQQANEALAKAEHHYHLMFNSVSDAVFIHGFDENGLPGHHWEVNDNACRYLGYTREELLRMGPRDIDAPEEHSEIAVRAKKILAAGHLIWEGTHVARDGRRIPVEVNTHVIDLDGSPAIMSSVRDISERKEIEKRYRDIFDGALEGMYRTSAEGKMLAVNSALAGMLGYESAEQIVSTVDDLAHQVWLDPNDRARFTAMLEEHESVRNLECQVKRKDGTAIWISVKGRKVRGADGETLYYDGFAEDISERKRAEAALEKANEAIVRAERHYRRIFNGVSDAVFVSTLLEDGSPGRFIEVNDRACAYLGYSREQLLQMGPRDVTAPEAAADIKAIRDRLFAAGHGLFETVNIARDGRRIPVEINAYIFDIDGAPTLLSSVRDISEREAAEAARAKLEEQLRHAQKLESVGRLAGGVAHDFNNLLTVINGYSALLLKGLGAGDPLRPYAGEIKSAGDRAASLTRQLLAFSRKQMIQPRVMDLNGTIRESVPMLERLIGEDIALETHLEPSLGQVMADPDQVHQVIMNLAVNARDAMPDGGTLDIATANVTIGEAEVASMHDAAAPGRYVLVTVTDTGRGMDETVRRQIFEPFFTTKEVGKGTGLGLSTVYGIVRQSGGWIDVWSEVGAGTSFRIYLPSIDARAVPERPGVGAPAEGGVETILVVEDQKAVLAFTAAALRQCGYQVLEAADGKEAIAVAGRHPGQIHLLLTDVVMPEMNGRELAERLKAVRPNLAVLFMSGYTADVIAHRGVLDRGIAFLHKPFSSAELAQKVRDALAVL